MEVAPFFVDFHHFLSIFTIFHRFSRFTHFCRDLHFVVIYSLFPQFFLAKIALSATSHVFCMYAVQSSSKSSSIEAGNNCFWWTLPKQVIAVVRNWNLSWRHCSTYTFYVKWELIWLKFLCYTFTLIYTYVGQRVL